MEHLLRLKVTTVCHLPQKLTFWFVGKLKGVSFWRGKKAWASNFEASSNLTFEKTSYNDKEIKRGLALAFRTEFSPCIAGSGRSIFGSSPESQNDKWEETVENIYEQRYLQHCCRNVSPVQLPFWPSFSLPAELLFCRVLISATRILPQFRPRVTKLCSFHFSMRSSFPLLTRHKL